MNSEKEHFPALINMPSRSTTTQKQNKTLQAAEPKVSYCEFQGALT